MEQENFTSESTKISSAITGSLIASSSRSATTCESLQEQTAVRNKGREKWKLLLYKRMPSYMDISLESGHTS
jgi:hypothetical protein